MKRTWKLFLLALAVLSVLMLSACGKSDDSEKQEPEVNTGSVFEITKDENEVVTLKMQNTEKNSYQEIVMTFGDRESLVSFGKARAIYDLNAGKKIVVDFYLNGEGAVNALTTKTFQGKGVTEFDITGLEYRVWIRPDEGTTGTLTLQEITDE